jgi:hypothetical protein
MHGFWPIFFLLVVLKIPVFASLALIWWASREPEPETVGEDSDGGFQRRNPQPKLPRGPRRGPHGGGAARRHPGALAQRRPGPSSHPAQRVYSSSADKESASV